MRIGVGIDGVIADIFSLLVCELNAYFGKNFNLNQISDYKETVLKYEQFCRGGAKKCLNR